MEDDSIDFELQGHGPLCPIVYRALRMLHKRFIEKLCEWKEHMRVSARTESLREKKFQL